MCKFIVDILVGENIENYKLREKLPDEKIIWSCVGITHLAEIFY